MINKEIEKELKSIKEKLEKTYAFAERLPFFKEVILKKKLTGDERVINFGNHYEKLYLGWGINRYQYKTDSLTTITNYNYEVDGSYDLPLFNIYINTCSLFDTHEQFGLIEAVFGLDVFFFDQLNTKFYATDEQIIPLLEVLNDWYIKASSKLNLYNAANKVKDAKKALEKAEEHYNKLKQEKGN